MQCKGNSLLFAKYRKQRLICSFASYIILPLVLSRQLVVDAGEHLYNRPQNPHKVRSHRKYGPASPLHLFVKERGYSIGHLLYLSPLASLS